MIESGVDDVALSIGTGRDRIVILGPPTAGHVDVLLDGASVRARDTIVLDESLSTFFAELDDSWRGWNGIRTWRSVGENLTLEATHDGIGLVSIRATLRESTGHGASDRATWSAALTVQVEPAALGSIATRIAELAAVDITDW